MKRIILIGLLVVLTGCGNVKDLKFTGKNTDNIMNKVKSSKDLTGEENTLLMLAMMRYSLKSDSLEGKRVGDLISEQKKIKDDMDAKEKEAKRLAEEAAKKEIALAEELSKYITVAPFKKSYRKADYMSGSYQDYINISFVFENKGAKDIKAFKGTSKFKDLFGEIIHEGPMTIDDGIKSGQKVNWTGSIKYNQFIPSNTKLRDTDLDKMKFEWVPKAIIFADGSKIGGDEAK